ncbi:MULTISPECIES: DnaD domain protein [Thermoactinomyces]|jgi:DNA replication protein|uniref:DnaD domain protein n=1 Tax=Thermoactinomyces daqus TaxID=1329516 RepID=A0A7W1X8X9_9BACL|nr:MULTISPECIES: DnaD domain protein [Thermoactinomyces]MBA4542180.1 DnaD domain protein [Thermoactinomyces daqus]MBH8598367.1 DnaD domain protein [Thermoactinomyces sp. CICC 10523]MBH8604492.1 DnaD domain protein [Thermoactinomyces sp. CICC 10522]MBH8607507.1 DnaD domain protein [Thermoactinomyces sp. CICC 10521]
MDGKGSVQTALVQLLQQGSLSLPVLLLTEYKRVGLSETEVMLLIHILFFQEKEQKLFPTVSELEMRMNLTQEQIVDMIQRLVRGGYLRIEHEVNEYGVRSERYSLVPLMQQLVSSFIDRDSAEEELDGETYDRVFQLFEQEFGRPLSPMECQMLARWIDEDGYSQELIESALREAVFCSKLNFRYIDRILFEWQRNNVRTAEEAVEYSRKFRQKGMLYQSGIREKQHRASGFSFYNWVNQE